MPHLTSLALFVLFLALGLGVARAKGERVRVRAIRLLVGYVVAASLVVVVSQRDAWPFTSYTLAAFPAQVDRTICRTEFLGVDAAGRAWRVDPYSWSPVYDSILQYWVEQELPHRPRDQQDDALRFLLERAEAGRKRLAAGQGIGMERLLGPFHARYWWMLRRPAEVADTPYRALRVDSVCWIPREHFRDPTRETRRRVAEYRP